MEPTDLPYDFRTIESEIQARWHAERAFEASDLDWTRPKYYCLSMFPYPSGKLHMGHVRNYTLSDVMARYQSMLGKNVLHPIGWDAFGLPAENAAIQHGVPPASWTQQNIQEMSGQLKALGLAFDWRRELKTCDPDYYRWEQWLFLQMRKKGLVYSKKSFVNWDPVDQTVLANEQVIEGRGWRSGALIERREIEQWFIRITAYAEELLSGLDTLTGWPSAVLQMQRNWIGRSEGASIDWPFEGHPVEALRTFTTRPDTLMGVAAVCIAPTHPSAQHYAKHSPQLAEFLTECRHTSTAEAELATQEKKGVFTGHCVIHPVTRQLIPVWIANFVLMEYGTGAVMCVPAHDERDHAFALQYGLPILQVIEPAEGLSVDVRQAAYMEGGTLIHSGVYDGLDAQKAKEVIVHDLQAQNLGEKVIHYRLRDWGVSRQRYWGTPIPIIHCPDCGAVDVPESDLPVVLPTEITFEGLTSPLKSEPAFYETTCPLCRKPAKRETDTFDTFVESSWYFARYASFDQKQTMLDERAAYWLPVDQYVGGIEHAVLHLLYARLFYKILRDVGLISSDEPFTALLTQGMVLKDGQKMSKSKGNTVDPQAYLERYGADTIRLFMLFTAPPEQSLEWNDDGVQGAHRFLKKLWRFAMAHLQRPLDSEDVAADPREWSAFTLEQKKSLRVIHQTIEKVTGDFERRQVFNTAIASMMELLNYFLKITPVNPLDMGLERHALEVLLQMLSPIAPHITQCLWEKLGYADLLLNVSWPKAHPDALLADQVTYAIQVNGKLRAQVAVASGLEGEALLQTVRQNPQVAKYLTEQQVIKSIVVPGRLVSFVVK